MLWGINQCLEVCIGCLHFKSPMGGCNCSSEQAIANEGNDVHCLFILLPWSSVASSLPWTLLQVIRLQAAPCAHAWTIMSNNSPAWDHRL